MADILLTWYRQGNAGRVEFFRFKNLLYKPKLEAL